MTVEKVDFKDLKDEVSFMQVIEMLGLNLRQEGNQLRGCCPIHNGTDKREFVITPDAGRDGRGLFNCFKCINPRNNRKGLGGDFIKLVALTQGITDKEAGIAIAKHFGVLGLGNSITVNSNSSNQPIEKGSDENVKRLIPRSLREYHKKLDPSHEEVEALGIESDTAKTFFCGFTKVGLLKNRIAIRVCSPDGEMVGYCGVATLEDQEPYIKLPDDIEVDTTIFNAQSIETDSVVELAPSPIAVLLANQCGSPNVISFLSESVNANQLRTLANFLEERNCSLA